MIRRAIVESSSVECSPEGFSASSPNLAEWLGNVSVEHWGPRLLGLSIAHAKLKRIVRNGSGILGGFSLFPAVYVGTKLWGPRMLSLTSEERAPH
jgi:hypothetical protein